MERVQSVLYKNNLDKMLWAKIANTVIYIKIGAQQLCVKERHLMKHGMAKNWISSIYGSVRLASGYLFGGSKGGLL